jgi:hypothetical protein
MKTFHMIFKMFKISYTLLFLILLGCSSNQNKDYINQPKESNSTVIICHGEDAFAYHIRFCRGLKNCEASTEEISQDEAIELGRRPCGFCF